MWPLFTQRGSCKYQHVVNCDTCIVFVVQVYIVTGGSADSDGSTETLIAGSSEWQYARALPSARGYLRGVTIDNQFYVLGEWWPAGIMVG